MGTKVLTQRVVPAPSRRWRPSWPSTAPPTWSSSSGCAASTASPTTSRTASCPPSLYPRAAEAGLRPGLAVRVPAPRVRRRPRARPDRRRRRHGGARRGRAAARRGGVAAARRPHDGPRQRRPPAGAQLLPAAARRQPGRVRGLGRRPLMPVGPRARRHGEVPQPPRRGVARPRRPPALLRRLRRLLRDQRQRARRGRRSSASPGRLDGGPPAPGAPAGRDRGVASPRRLVATRLVLHAGDVDDADRAGRRRRRRHAGDHDHHARADGGGRVVRRLQRGALRRLVQRDRGRRAGQGARARRRRRPPADCKMPRSGERCIRIHCRGYRASVVHRRHTRRRAGTAPRRADDRGVGYGRSSA